MNERTIEGELLFWAKEIKENPGAMLYYTAGLKIAEAWHNIVADTKEALTTLKEHAPRGSKVQFIERSDDSGKWFYKPETFTVLEKGSGQSGKKPWVGRSRYDSPEQEAREIRGKCLMYSKDTDVVTPPAEMIAAAKKFEDYIWGKEAKKSDGVEITEEEVTEANKIMTKT